MKSLFFSTGGIHLATMTGMLGGILEHVSDAGHFGGISAGALLASLCAIYGPIDAYQLTVKHSHDTFLIPNYSHFNSILSFLFKDSLLNSEHLTTIVKELVHNKPLQATLHIGYTNKETMEYVSKTFERGTTPIELYKHIVASMSIPLILPAVEIDGIQYMDGGVFHSIPIEAINHLVSDYENKDEPLNLMILASKPFDYALHQNKNKHSYFKTVYDAYKYAQGYECISIHNDKQLLDEILKNAGLNDKHINYQLYCVAQQDAEKWNKAIPMNSYGHIRREHIDELVNLGKQIVKDIKYRIDRIDDKK